MKKHNKILNTLTRIFCVFCCFIFLAGYLYYCLHLFYGNFTFRQFLFHAAAVWTMNLSWISVGCVCLLLLLIGFAGIFVLKKPLRWLPFYFSANHLSLLHKHPYFLSFITSFFTAAVGIFLLCYSSIYTLPEIYKQFKFVTAIIFHQEKYDTFFEKHYTEPVSLDFSLGEPKNIIIIFAESLERTFFNQNVFEENLLPRLSAQNASSFVGYADQDETNWTQSGLTAVLCGVTSKLYMPPRPLSKNLQCIPSVFSKFGYQTYYLQGTDLSFAFTRELLLEHGMQILEDIEDTKAQATDTVYAVHFINEVQSDSALLGYFKKRIKDLAADTRPFLAVTMTMNTHPYRGHIEKDCRRKYQDMRDVILCTDEQLNDFVEWFKMQDFASNTTLIILGDHLMMYSDIHPYLDLAPHRETLNLLFGSGAPEHNIYKPFYQFDWAPTLLELADFKWQNHQYGLGVSLLSNDKTLREKYGETGAVRLLNNSKFYETFIKPK